MGGKKGLREIEIVFVILLEGRKGNTLPPIFFCLLPDARGLALVTDGVEGIATDDKAVLRPEPPVGTARKPEVMAPHPMVVLIFELCASACQGGRSASDQPVHIGATLIILSHQGKRVCRYAKTEKCLN